MLPSGKITDHEYRPNGYSIRVSVRALYVDRLRFKMRLCFALLRELPFAALRIDSPYGHSVELRKFRPRSYSLRRTVRPSKLWSLAFLLLAPCCYAGTYTAASCNTADVNAVINGGTHKAVDGDVIQIPSGTCTWTSGIAVPSNIGITIIGSGTPNSGASTTAASASCSATALIDNITSGSGMFFMGPKYGNSTSRISCINFVPGSGKGIPVHVTGTCTTSGCPNLRLDNLTVPEGWAGIGISDDAFSVINDVFGVADHNTVGGPTSVDNGVDFINLGFGAWQGVGFWGDNSWATPDTLGSAQAFYLENNTFTNSFGTDMDTYPSNGNFGGGRAVCRFNVFNSVTLAGACTDHGTDTIGRVRGGRQIEFYDNTLTCPSGNCNVFFGGRSAVLYGFGNTLTSGSVGSYVAIDTERRWRVDPWGPCDGSSAWDVNDGTTYSSGTVGSESLSGANYVVTGSGSPGWTTSEWQPNPVGSPYSFHDVTQNFGFEIASNTTNSFTSYFSCYDSGCSNAPAAGDSYQILRASVCLDQTGRGQGLLVEGGDGTLSTSGHLTPILVSTGSPGSVAEALDPSYEVDDSGTVRIGTFLPADSHGEIANRDWYAQSVGQTAQTSPTAPFNGTTGTGWGTLVNRPATCTKGVGYLATDQGTWDTVSGGPQGVLFVCSATNTWSLNYTPYTYPHPLESGESKTPPTPTGVTGSVSTQ